MTIPVAMLHSVGCNNTSWLKPHLSIDLGHFEHFCAWLSRQPETTIFLDEWYRRQGAHQNGENGKDVVLTFDDGYLDNWVFVYPILKKYGLKATVFVNPEFVQSGEKARKTLEDAAWNSASFGEHEKLGFMNWAEIKALQESGIVDIQSHSMSHNFYFCSDKFQDIYTGQPEYYWMAWPERPDRKPYYLNEDQRSYVPAGSPVFEKGRALGLRRYFPDPRLTEAGAKLLEQENEGTPQMLQKLKETQDKYPGRFETDEEMEKRYRYELFESKAILEQKLDKPVEFLCWPGGGYNELSLRLSEKAGYKASTIGAGEKNLKNKGLKSQLRIKRFGMGSHIKTKRGYAKVNNSRFLILDYKNKTGSFSSRIYKGILKSWFKMIK